MRRTPGKDSREAIDTAELERRMRPGGWSAGGFLGHNEQLADVLAADERTLAELGLTRDEIADPLSVLSGAPVISLTEDPKLVSRLKTGSDWVTLEARLNDARAILEQRFGVVERVSENVARVGGRYEVETWGFMGVQECPWGPQLGGDACATSSTEWRIRDTTREVEMRGPGLITHLITDHGFFEGFESPYRVDPRALAELLRLGPFAANEV